MGDAGLDAGCWSPLEFPAAPRHDIPDSIARNSVILPQGRHLENRAAGSTPTNPRGNMEARRIRRHYDPRFRELVHETGDIELAVRNGVPRSTARDWSRLSLPKVVTLDVASMSDDELRREVIELREHNATLLAVLRLVVVLLKVCEVSLRHRRVPSGEKKRLLLRAVDRSREVLSLRKVLLVIGLSLPPRRP